MQKLLLAVLSISILYGCSSGGGGGGETPPQDPPVSLSRSVSGGGVKGPLANADVAFHYIDTTQENFQSASAAATGRTNANAAFVDITLPDPNVPYILVFSVTDAQTCAADSSTCTTDLTTGEEPVLKTLKTVILPSMLADADDDGNADGNLYATPLTTMAVNLAIKNADSSDAPWGGNGDTAVTKEEFLNAIQVAADQVTSSFGFGATEKVDIYTTPPLVDETTDSTDELAGVAEYRSAVEALAAVVYQIDQQSAGTDTDTVLDELTADLADGEVDGNVDGQASTIIDDEKLEVLDQEPSTLPVPGAFKKNDAGEVMVDDQGNPIPVTVNDVKEVLEDETEDTGQTNANTTNLANVTVELQPAEKNPDRDGDGVTNLNDAFPDDINESVDTDGDGIGNNQDLDDDGDGVADTQDAFPLNAAESVDTDGDNIGNNADSDDDGDGTPDISDDFPLDASRQNKSDQDNDGWPAGQDTDDNDSNVPSVAYVDTDNDGLADSGGAAPDSDDDNDGVPDVDDDFPTDAAEHTDTDNDGTGDNADPDIDGDNVNNDVDAFPFNANEQLDTDKDKIGNNADTDDDNDGVADDVEAVRNTDPLKRDTDGDGRLDGADKFPLNPEEWVDRDLDGVGDNEDTDDDNDGLSDADEKTAGTKPLVPDTDNDGVLDGADAFPLDKNETLDTDGDGIGNNADTDDDGDGTPDVDDDFPLDDSRSSANDLDGDGWDAAWDPDDNDDQNPGPNVPFVDTDGDGIPNTDAAGNQADGDDDGDGVIDVNDDCPLDPSGSKDTDSDGTCDSTDTDIDGDNVDNASDAFPYNPNESADTDGDGVGDNADAFPNDASETKDSDQDGIGDTADTDDDNDNVPDTQDAFPLNPNESVDSDGDGTGNNSDADDDNDGVADLDGNSQPLDNCPTTFNPNQENNDGDAEGDICDADDDNDGVNDDQDAFPFDGNETVDTDGDGIGNNADTDDDNDGVADTDEESGCELLADCDGDGVNDDTDDLPTNPNETVDTDNDGVGNNEDTDDDNDGVLDTEEVAGCDLLADCDDDGVNDNEDAFPTDGNETVDTDGDGIGNNTDTDDDGDNVADANEAAGCALLADCDSDGVNDDTDNCPIVANQGQEDSNNNGIGDACDATASDTEAMLTAGFSIFESDNYWDDLRQIDLTEYWYENISWNSGNGALTFSGFVYDVINSQWQADNSPDNNIVLTENGWTDASVAGETEIVTVNNDGSATLERSVGQSVIETTTIVATEVALEGLTIADSFTNQDPEFAAAISPANAVFSTGAIGYDLTLTSSSSLYEIWCKDEADPITGDRCWRVEIGDGSGNGTRVQATALNQLLVASTQLGNNQEWEFSQWVGETSTHWYFVEFVGTDASAGQSGTANYLAQNKNDSNFSLVTSGTWSSVALNSETLLTFSIPQTVLDLIGEERGDRFYSVYDGYVRSGDVESENNTAPGEFWRVFGSIARDDIIASFAAPLPNSDGDSHNDYVDNCPFVDNENQADFNQNGLGDACEDSDKDGVNDDVDICASVPNPNQDLTDDNQNNIPDECETTGGGGQPGNLSMFISDTDGDGIVDSLDAFPNDANEQFDTDGDGTGDNSDADADGDNDPNTSDPCPLIANATTCDASAIEGAHRIDWTVATGGLVVNAEPQPGFCFGSDAEGDTGMEVLAITNYGSGVIIIDGEIRGTYDSSNGNLVATWTDSREKKYWDDQNQQEVFLTVTENGSLNMTFNAGSWTGTFSATDTTAGGEVDCVRTENISGNLVYTPTGGEDYNGVYGFELASDEWDDVLQTSILVRDAHAGELSFDAQNGLVDFGDGDGYRTPIQQFYDPASGGFHYVGVVEEVFDADGDQNDDLMQHVLTIHGVLVEPSTSSGTPELWFRVETAELFYSNTTAYTGQDADNVKRDFEGEGYAQRRTTQPFHFVTRIVTGSGNEVNRDVIGLRHPPMMRADANSALSLEVYEGIGTGGNSICSTTYADRLGYLAQLPHPDMSLAAMRTAPYAYVTCTAAAGTVVATGTYTMAIRDDMGTPGDTGDDVVLWDDADGTYTAVTTHTVPSTVPDRAAVDLNGATTSQSEVGAYIPVSGFINPMQDVTISFPAEAGADIYSARLWEFDTFDGSSNNKEIRVNSATNSIVVPANTLLDTTAIKLRARFDDGNNNGTVSFSQSADLVAMPGIHGLMNVEVVNSGNGDAQLFQIDLHSDGSGGVNCGVNNPSFNCSYTSNAIDWLNNTVTLDMTDDDMGTITGTAFSNFTLTLAFSDSVNASATMASYTGVASIVNTEFVARSRIRANGATSTQLTVQNAPPSYSTATMTTASGTTVLDSASNTSLSLWENVSGTVYDDAMATFWVFPVDGSEVQRIHGRVDYDSFNGGFTGLSRELGNDTYIVSVTGDVNGFLPDRTFAVDYAFADPTGIVGGPLATVITVDTTTIATGVGDTSANAIDLTTLANFNMSWTSTLPTDTIWRVKVDAWDVVNNTAIQDSEARTMPLTAGDGELAFDTVDTWTWTNPGDLDPRNLLQSGETARILILTFSLDGTMVGSSGVFYVTQP